jgi:hypothetical protein
VAVLVKKLLERGVTALANGRPDRPAMPPVNAEVAPRRSRSAAVRQHPVGETSAGGRYG